MMATPIAWSQDKAKTMLGAITDEAIAIMQALWTQAVPRHV
jgi:hypothetical protein